LGIADNTIVVVYTTDNGAELMTWPYGGSTPFCGEKSTNWEGGFRVPTVIRWSTARVGVSLPQAPSGNCTV
jgi:arylsulfatase